MKHLLLSITFFLAFSIHAQEAEESQKARHSFNLSGGLFTQNGDAEYRGWTSSLGYQVHFPNRFVFGLYGAMDRSFFMSVESGNPDAEEWRKLKAFSGGMQLGIHLIRKKHFDFSLLILPHFNIQEIENKRHYIESDTYEMYNSKMTYIFTPIFFHRLQAFYKFNPSHGLGLAVDLNFDLESDGLFSLFDSYYLFVGRLMLTYRITIPNK